MRGAIQGYRDQKKLNQIQTKELHIGLQKSSTFNVIRARGDLEKRLNRQGITVTWSEFTSGPPLLEALAAGKVDVGETGDAPVIFAQAKMPRSFISVNLSLILRPLLFWCPRDRLFVRWLI